MKHRFFIQETSETDDSALGTGVDTNGEPDTSSAETEKTDTGPAGSQETIPYSRFKEVNDRYRGLKPFEELADAGYDADSLRNLAELDAAFAQDPFSTTAQIIETLDLPTETKTLLKKSLEDGSPTAVAQRDGPKPSGDQRGEDEIPKWAQDMQQRLDERDKADEDAELSATVDGMLDQWRSLDKEAELEPLTDKTMLTYIISASQREGDPDDILRVAREEFDETQAQAMKRTLKPGDRRGGNRPVPSGGAAVNNADEPPKTLADATQLAKNYLEQQSE
jgi:hypothetical protein